MLTLGRGCGRGPKTVLTIGQLVLQDRNGSSLMSLTIDQHNVHILKELINTRKIHGGTRVRVGENVNITS